MPTRAKTAPSALELRTMQAIQAELDAQKRTIQWLADAVDLSRPQVSKALAGEKPVTLTEVERMCVALGLNPVRVIRDAREASLAAAHKPSARGVVARTAGPRKGATDPQVTKSQSL